MLYSSYYEGVNKQNSRVSNIFQPLLQPSELPSKAIIIVRITEKPSLYLQHSAPSTAKDQYSAREIKLKP